MLVFATFSNHIDPVPFRVSTRSYIHLITKGSFHSRWLAKEGVPTEMSVLALRRSSQWMDIVMSNRRTDNEYVCLSIREASLYTTEWPPIYRWFEGGTARSTDSDIHPPRHVAPVCMDRSESLLHSSTWNPWVGPFMTSGSLLGYRLLLILRGGGSFI